MHVAFFGSDELTGLQKYPYINVDAVGKRVILILAWRKLLEAMTSCHTTFIIFERHRVTSSSVKKRCAVGGIW
jgi:hypothetical protein